jgi:general nucleoside transport system permease protein
MTTIRAIQRRRSFDLTKILINFLLPIGGFAFALIIGGIMLLFIHVNPLTAYSAMLQGAVGSTFGLTQSLVKATPLLLVGLGICIAQRAMVFNIGGPGQITMGALAATWFSLTYANLPGYILIPLTLFMGFLSGAFWGLIPAILKVRLKVNEILSTLMLNAIAISIMNYLILGPLLDPEQRIKGTFLPQSAQLPSSVWLPKLVPQTMLNAGAILALVLAVVVYFFLWRTTIGYRIRAVGLNANASRYAGINVPFYQAFSLTVAGGFSGIAGVVELLGIQHRLVQGIDSGYGFTGMVAALLGGLHPLGSIPASILFGGLMVGGDQMQRAVQVPASLVGAIQGLVVLFVSGSALLSIRWAARSRIDNSKDEAANHE